MTRPVALVILDGFGIGDGGRGDAIAAADAPFFERCERSFPKARLETSGAAVGLPDGQMGNSEVGHMTLGAGRIILHDLIRVQRAIDEGRLGEIPALRRAIDTAREAGGAIHLMGLVSDGGVHSALSHLEGLITLLETEGVRPILHAFTDGRDTAPQSALRFIPKLENRIRACGGCIATVSGRYWAMDRDQRWERVARAVRAITQREGLEAATAVEAVEKAYARGEGDEFIQPTVVGDARALGDGDAVLHFNFRADRARELTNALTRVAPGALGEEIESLPRVTPGYFATLTEYDATFGLPALFPPERIRGSLGEQVSRAGLRQLRIAETEKYAHVTYFFNGGVEDALPGEDRILIPSPRDVATYDLRPEMSAAEVTDALVAALDEQDYAFVLVNFANPDMVGHTGVLPAGVRAVETVDHCLARVADAILSRGGSLLVTADHGNVEQMIDPETGGPHTAHTTGPVPVWWVTGDARGCTLRSGGLADVAPTLCELLDLSPTPEMSGHSLLECDAPSSTC